MYLEVKYFDFDLTCFLLKSIINYLLSFHYLIDFWFVSVTDDFRSFLREFFHFLKFLTTKRLIKFKFQVLEFYLYSLTNFQGVSQYLYLQQKNYSIFQIYRFDFLSIYLSFLNYLFNFEEFNLILQYLIKNLSKLFHFPITFLEILIFMLLIFHLTYYLFHDLLILIMQSVMNIQNLSYIYHFLFINYKIFLRFRQFTINS